MKLWVRLSLAVLIVISLGVSMVMADDDQPFSDKFVAYDYPLSQRAHAALARVRERLSVEAEAQGFFWHDSYMTSRLEVNGKEANPGPYPFTYLVPKEGGTVTVYWAEASTQAKPDYSTRSKYAFPGEWVDSFSLGRAWYFSTLKDWQLCGYLKNSLPQIQLDEPDLYGVCVYAPDNPTLAAAISRAGYERAPAIYPKGYKVFVSRYGDSRLPNEPWTGKWYDTDFAVVGTYQITHQTLGDHASVAVYTAGIRKYFGDYFIGKMFYAGSDSLVTEISAKENTGVLFVPVVSYYSESSNWSWKDIQIYRVTRWSPLQILVVN